MSEADVRRHIAWMAEPTNDGPPAQDGAEGSGYTLQTVVAPNPFGAPPGIRVLPNAILGSWNQLPNGGWVGSFMRGRTSARQCVRNALDEASHRRGDWAVRWLQAGQAHNADARGQLGADTELTLRVLEEFRGAV